jgi:putative DNA primase/helicase
MKLINYYTAKDRFQKVWKERKEPWDDLVARLTAEVRSTETMAEWQAMPRERKGMIKDVGGFVAGALKDGLRHPQNVLNRTMVVLDADYAKPGLWDTWGLLFGTAAVLHQTHSWRPDHPKLRLIVPLSRPVEPILYKAISVHLADELGADQFDPTTHETNRLMYWPSLPRDADHDPRVLEGAFLDVDAWVADHPRWDDLSTWPLTVEVKDPAKKLGDPGEKGGIIGAFCRAHDIVSAIDTYLSDRYTPGSTPDRYTWAEGTASNGLHLLDGGVHAISHHGTDPVQGRVVNAWDLVRIHLFGEEDTSRMYLLADEDPAVTEELEKERGTAAEVFLETGTADPVTMFFRLDAKTRRLTYTPKFVGDWYAGLQPVATFGGQLYRYQDGRYVPGETHFNRVTAEAMDVEYTSARIKDALAYLLSVAPQIIDPFGTSDRLNVQNGLLDLSTLELDPHDPAFLSTVQLPWAYDPEATCPLIDAFFKEYAGDHAELVWYMAAYTLMETMRFEKSFILLGGGGNGKGTTLELITQMLGQDNVSNVSLHKLESNRFSVANVVGKMANIQSDLPAKLLESEGVVKQLTSGDRLEAERKNKDSVMIRPRAKLMFSTNELPKTMDNSDGFYRKWVVITYPKKFDDSNLRKKFFDELPGMFAKAVKYANKLANMSKFPGDGEVEAYRVYSDSVYAFLKEEVVKDPEGQISKADLYDHYRNYCFEEGLHPVSKKRFTQKVRSSLELEEARNKQERAWIGLKLVTDV